MLQKTPLKHITLWRVLICATLYCYLLHCIVYCEQREQREEISVKEQSKSTPQKPVKNKKNEKNKVKYISSSKARTCLSIDDKVELIKYHESHPQLGGRTQVSTIIKNKESILDKAIHVTNQAR
jgi:hypothetical protein